MISEARQHDTARELRRRERVAWAILLSAAALFVAFVVAVVGGAAWYREAAMTARSASLDEIIGGTVLYQSEQLVREAVAAKGQKLQDGDRLRTAGDGQALVSLPDGSVIRLWPETAIQVRQLRSSTYTANNTAIVLVLLNGHARFDVALTPTLERRFELITPHGRALLREGNYRVEVSGWGSEIAVRSGSATVTGRDESVEVLRQERTVVLPNATPTTPGAALRNLIQNGDFRLGFETWQRGSRNEEDGVFGQTQIVEEEGRYAVRLRRSGSRRHGEAFIHQAVNRDVRDESILRLTLDAKVVSQSLSGGGVLGSEYPLMVRVRYRDAFGSENSIVRGLYVSNPDGRPTTYGLAVPAKQWLPITIDLFDVQQVQPRPAHILWIEVEGSGWEFESLVTGVQLLAE